MNTHHLMNEAPESRRLTVIVPHYNSPEKLQRLVASIPVQDWIEIVIVDDNSRESIDGLFSSRPGVKILKVPTGRKGGGAARNVGLENSQGDWLLFADADDFFVAGAFDSIQEYLNADVDVVYFAPTSMKEATGEVGGRHLHYKELLERYSRTSDKALLYKYFVPWSKLISRRLVDENAITFDEVIASNDMNFSLKVAYYARRHTVNMAAIYCVTESESSLTKQTSLAVLESRLFAAVRYNQFLQAHGEGRYQIGVSLQLYNMRRLGMSTVMKYLAYSVRNRMPLQRGLKPLARQMLRDLKGA